ncbi:MAG: GAF domain-containing protein [Gammaproteobacteria bacterium]|nr:GAF domain-containing protein [Gammaproteobacteria bacterium]MDH3767408.1 GAF domain-containing protein [Gammaproteobacteria bacterium]
MQEPGLPENEEGRLETLHSLNILDTPPDDRFDRYTRISTRIFDMPVAVISLVDRYRQWFKSTEGFEGKETPRSVSFCGHAILGDDILEVRNTRRDPRFRDNPLVVQRPHIQFYAGAPLTAPNGHKLGTLCLIDRVPRHLSDAEKVMLRNLADMVVGEIVNYTDTKTGLDNRNALLIAGAKCFDMDPAERRFSLLLFDLTNVVAAQSDAEREIPPEETFTKLVRNHFPNAQSIAYLGREDFCILLQEDETFDEEKAISQLCEDARNLIYPDAKHHSFSALVGRIQYQPEKYTCIDDMLQDADLLFFERDKLASPETCEEDRASRTVDRWRNTPAESS